LEAPREELHAVALGKPPPPPMINTLRDAQRRLRFVDDWELDADDADEDLLRRQRLGVADLLGPVAKAERSLNAVVALEHICNHDTTTLELRMACLHTLCATEATAAVDRPAMFPFVLELLGRPLEADPWVTNTVLSALSGAAFEGLVPREHRPEVQGHVVRLVTEVLATRATGSTLKSIVRLAGAVLEDLAAADKDPVVSGELLTRVLTAFQREPSVVSSWANYVHKIHRCTGQLWDFAAALPAKPSAARHVPRACALGSASVSLGRHWARVWENDDLAHVFASPDSRLGKMWTLLEEEASKRWSPARSAWAAAVANSARAVSNDHATTEDRGGRSRSRSRSRSRRGKGRDRGRGRDIGELRVRLPSGVGVDADAGAGAGAGARATMSP
jgi:hypothetical protein